MTQLLHTLLDAAATRWPDALALVTHEPEAGRYSYAQVQAAARAAAAALGSLGVTPGDRVALLAHNGLPYVAAYAGALACGAIVVPLNTALDAHSLARSLADCTPRVLIVGPRLERTVVALAAVAAAPVAAIAAWAAHAPLAHAFPHLTLHDARAWTAEAVLTAPPVAAPSVDLPPDASAVILYTSGSTGTPRGAELTHPGIVANTHAIVSYLGLTASDRVLVVLPFFYVYGASLLHTAWASGACLVIENRFQYPNVALDTLAAEACTGLAGVPSTFAILLTRSNLRDRDLPALRFVTQAGGGMPPARIHDLQAALPGRALHIMYGATEASARLATLPPDELASALGSIGRAINGVVLTVRRGDGTPCAIDEVGELFAESPSLMRGYWQDPDETARVLGPHGYATGDLARCDGRGLLWLVGRKKDMLKVAGHRVASREIEDAIAACPEVQEAAVIGVPDEIQGDRLIAFVIAAPGASLDAPTLGRFLKDRLPGYKIPGRIEFVEHLPRSSAGKVMKEQLKAQAQEAGL